MTPRQTKKHIDIKPECAYRHKILEIISEILNVILLNICKKIYNNNFLQHPLFVKKNICEMIIKYNKSYTDLYFINDVELCVFLFTIIIGVIFYFKDLISSIN
jgi:hypothetical protein